MKMAKRYKYIYLWYFGVAKIRNLNQIKQFWDSCGSWFGVSDRPHYKRAGVLLGKYLI